MIDKQLLHKTIDEFMEGSDLFLVDLKVTPNNEITVTVDSTGSMDIEQCLALTHRIEETFDRDVEDYELEVGSAGITAPFKVKEQYEKNIGNDVVVLTRSGKKLHGVLKSVSDDFESCVVTTFKKVKPEGQKRPVSVEEDIALPISDIKSITYDLKF